MEQTTRCWCQSGLRYVSVDVKVMGTSHGDESWGQVMGDESWERVESWGQVMRTSHGDDHTPSHSYA